MLRFDGFGAVEFFCLFLELLFDESSVPGGWLVCLELVPDFVVDSWVSAI